MSLIITIYYFIKQFSVKTNPISNSSAVMIKFGLCFIAIYCSAIIYLGITSVISFDVRMFVPLIPTILLIFSIIITYLIKTGTEPSQRFLLGLTVVMSTIYIAANLESVIRSLPETPQHEIVRLNLSREISPGHTISSWISDNIQSTDIIVANRGQATGYLLNRPTISLVSLEYSNHRWEEDAVKSMMQQYHAKFLIIYSGVKPELYHSVFLSGLQEGNSPPWLNREVIDSEVKIYRFDSPS